MAQKALKRMTAARTRLIIRQPFFGTLALHLDMIECKDQAICPTMATDGVTLLYNPDFVEKLTDQEVTGVIAHEAMHAAFGHMSRRGHRDHVLYNIAGDYSINGDLLKAGITLPKERLHDPKYDGMSTEEIYERLRQDSKKQQGPGQQPGQGGQGKSGTQDPGRCGTVMDAGTIKGNGSGAQQTSPEEIAHNWDVLVQQAVAIAEAAHAGKVPAYLERLVSQLKQPRVPWRELARRFIDDSMSRDYSWTKPNRRYLSQNLCLPGFIPDRMHRLVMIMDVSGSIDDEMMQAFGGEVAGALNEGVADQLTVLYADTDVKKVDEFLPGDLVKIKTLGGGGTAFDRALEWVNKNALDAACVVYLTDMETSAWGTEPHCPLLWAAYNNTPRLAVIRPSVPFGEILHVDAI